MGWILNNLWRSFNVCQSYLNKGLEMACRSGMSMLTLQGLHTRWERPESCQDTCSVSWWTCSNNGNLVRGRTKTNLKGWTVNQCLMGVGYIGKLPSSTTRRHLIQHNPVLFITEILTDESWAMFAFMKVTLAWRGPSGKVRDALLEQSCRTWYFDASPHFTSCKLFHFLFLDMCFSMRIPCYMKGRESMLICSRCWPYHHCVVEAHGSLNENRLLSIFLFNNKGKLHKKGADEWVIELSN